MSELILLLLMAAHFFVLHAFIKKYLLRVQRLAAGEIISSDREEAINAAFREAAMYKYFSVFFVIVLLICFPELSKNSSLIDMDFLINTMKLISLSAVTIFVRIRFLKIKFAGK